MILKDAIELPTQACYLATARGMARSLLDHAFIDSNRKDDILLIVGELCTNVIRHARQSPHETYRIELEITDGTIRVTVTDRGQGFDRRQVPPSIREEAGGRGLEIVEALADQVIFSEATDGGFSVQARLFHTPRG